MYVTAAPELTDGSVTTAKLADGAVTGIKVADRVRSALLPYGCGPTGQVILDATQYYAVPGFGDLVTSLADGQQAVTRAGVLRQVVMDLVQNAGGANVTYGVFVNGIQVASTQSTATGKVTITVDEALVAGDYVAVGCIQSSGGSETVRWKATVEIEVD